jgi:hypothetical protein
MTQPDNTTPVRVEIETEKVPGVIELEDFAAHLVRSASQVRQSSAAAGPVDERAERIARLAAALAGELHALGDQD